MPRRIRWLGAAMVACFVLLFVQLNNFQVVKAHEYSDAPNNPQVLAAKFGKTRGPILSADGMVLAQSVLAPKGSTYKYQRVYPTKALFGQITGVFSLRYSSYGVEAYYNSYLLSHDRPVKTLGDLLSNQTVTDTVTLTLSDKLQTDAMNALAGRDGAIVVLDPSTGAIEAMYSNPSFDPNPLTSETCVVFKMVGGRRECAQTASQHAMAFYTTPDSEGFPPFTSLAYQDIGFPGSTFKIVTSAAAYEHAPQLVNTPIKYYACIPPGTFKGQSKQLCNFDPNKSCGGTIADMLPPSCDTGFAILGTRVGAFSMAAEADSFGFNQQPPIDLPHSPSSSPDEVSQFLQPGCYQNAEVFLAYASIGQDCTKASPLQMAMVAAGIANGGRVMTPHVMSQIRDSQGNLVETYTPKRWLQATSPQTASAINKLMTEVVTSGTAAGIFPASEDVAAKTGTAQIQNAAGVDILTNDWMIAFAPASAPKVAIAVYLPDQPVSDTGAEKAGPVMATMISDTLGGP